MFNLKAKLKIIPGVVLEIEITAFCYQFPFLIVFFYGKRLFQIENVRKFTNVRFFIEEFENEKNLTLRKSDTPSFTSANNSMLTYGCFLNYLRIFENIFLE
jgi:hypothetical protein